MNQGSLVSITAQQVLVMFLLILVGYLAVRAQVLGAEARRSFSALLVNIVVPAMIVDSYLIPFDPDILANLVRTALVSTGALLIGLGIALLATRRMQSPDRPILRFAITFSNAGYMGFPLIEALFGAEGLLYASIFNTFFNILIWTAGIALLDPGAKGANPVRELVKKPALLAVALGLVLYLGRVPVPDLIAQPIGLLGGMNTPLSMLITGIIIATSDLKAVIRRGALWQTILLRMLAVPAAAVLLCLGGCRHPARSLPLRGHHLGLCGPVPLRRAACGGRCGGLHPAVHRGAAPVRPLRPDDGLIFQTQRQKPPRDKGRLLPALDRDACDIEKDEKMAC